MKSECIGFSSFEEWEFKSRFKDALTEEFDVENGPLWHVKVCPNTEKCAIPEAKINFPFQYHVILVSHHAITDGTSNFRICNHFLSILNDVLKENLIDDSKQLGIHFTDQHLKPILKPLRNLCQPGSQEYEETMIQMRNINQSSNLIY